MGWPQIAIIILYTLNLGMYLVKHGEPQEGKYNFWIGLAGCGIQVFLLIMGGFFR